MLFPASQQTDTPASATARSGRGGAPVRWIALALLLISAPGPALALEPGSGITSRPSALPLTLPDYVPAESTPGFTPPPLPARTGPSVPSPGARFVVEGYRFEGNSVFPDRELQEIARPFTVRPVALADLEELRHRLTLKYIENGYVNSGALLPDQKVTDGIVVYRIVEGRLNEMRVRGTERLDPGYVRERLRLGAGPPLNTGALQESFQLLLADPLIERMNATLAPGAQPGESVLDVEVARAQPYELSASIDNHRPPSTGAEEARLDGRLHNPAGLGDLLDLSLQRTMGATDYRIGYAFPVTARDTRLLLRYQDTSSSIIEQPLADLDIDSRTWRLDAGLTHPLYRTPSRNLTLGAYVSLGRNETHLLGLPFSFSPGAVRGVSRVSAIRLMQEYTRRGADQAFAARSLLSIGVDAFGATTHDGGLPDSRFIAWLLQLQYARRILDNGAQLILRGGLQLADDRLVPLERIALGGANSVRGYRENELVRDQGGFGSLELRYPLTGPAGSTLGGLPGKLQIAPFVDFGYGRDKGGGAGDDRLLSVGLGLLWSLPPRFTAELYLARDLYQAPNPASDYNLQDDGVHFRLTAAIF